MSQNLEKNVKRWLKRKVSITVAVVTLFAINGSIGVAADNKAAIDAEVGRSTLKDTEHDTAILENTEKIAETEKTIEKHEVLVKILEEGKADKVETERALADLGKKLADEEKDRTNNDNKLTENIHAEIDRSISKDNEHDSAILENTKGIGEVKKAVETHGVLVKALEEGKADKVETEGALADLGKKLADEEKDRTNNDNKLTENIHAEIDRSISKDNEHDSAILENTKGIGEVKKAVETHGVLVKALEEGKADKVKTEKDLADLGKKLTTEEKDRKSTDTKHDSAILKNTNKIGEIENTANAHELAIDGEVSRSTSKDKQHDAAIEKNRDTIAKNFTNQEEKIQANKRSIEHLNKKVNKGTSMLVAMANVDFPNLGEGDIGIGAGVGSYSGEQAVAVGIAYAVNEDMKLQAKWSAVAGDPHYNAIGGGISYRFRTR